MEEPARLQSMGCIKSDKTEGLDGSYPYVTIGKTISLTKQTFVSRVMSLLFNIPSRFVITFSSKEQASFNFMAAVTICTDLGSEENTVSHCFHCFPIYLP